jgi:hypothetical protein
MKSKIPKRTPLKPPLFLDGKTRTPDSRLDEGAAAAFREVEPEGFKDHARSSIEAAAVDPDVDDSEGGE